MTMFWLARHKTTAGLQRAGVLAAATVLLAFAAAARAEMPEEGIVVQGSGSAKAKPTEIEIAGSISSEAELASDATVKYRDAKRRAVSTIESLKNANLSVDFSGFSINSTLDPNTQLMIQQGRTTTAGKQKIQVLENCKLVLQGIDQLSSESLMETVLKVIDTAKDAGFQIGPAPVSNYNELQIRQYMGNAIISFKIPDSTAVRDSAYRAAMEDARAKAAKMAELAGVKLGRVVAIQETPELKNTSNSYYENIAEALIARAAGAEKSISSTTFGEQTLRVSLTVRFEIAK